MRLLFICMILPLSITMSDSPRGSEPTGFLIDAQGEVLLHRRFWSRSLPVSLGAELRFGDTVRLKKNARVRILCPDLLTTWQPPPQSESGVFQECPQKFEIIRIRHEQEALGVRNSEQEPSVLMPSNTAVLDPTPWIRWEVVSGKSRYRVSLSESRNPSRPFWGPTLVDGTAIRYTGRPALAAGVEYLVRVEAEGGSSAQGGPFFLGPLELLHKVGERRQKFQENLPEEVSRKIAMAVYLLSQGLRSEALLLLDDLVTKNDSPALQLLRARTLGEVGAKATEIEAFRSALHEAELKGDQESEAEALLGLTRSVAKRGEAMDLSRRAARIFRDLGEVGRAEALERNLRRLQGEK